jgi:hypothetical protein
MPVVVECRQNWMLWVSPVGTAVVVFTLLSEGALLFVAAQTGFVAGPRRWRRWPWTSGCRSGSPIFPSAS